MGNPLKSRYNFLHDVTRLPKRERRTYMNQISENNLHVICEAAHNVLNGGCRKGKSKKNKHVCNRLMKRGLRKLADPKFDIEEKRKILSSRQSGDGIFTMIASTVLPFLLNLLRK